MIKKASALGEMTMMLPKPHAKDALARSDVAKSRSSWKGCILQEVGSCFC